MGPLLFNIFINDLNFCVSNVSLRLYADDTTAYLSDVSPTILEFSFNKDLRTWFESNRFTVNSTQTQALFFGQKNSLSLSLDSVLFKCEEEQN